MDILLMGQLMEGLRLIQGGFDGGQKSVAHPTFLHEELSRFKLVAEKSHRKLN